MAVKDEYFYDVADTPFFQQAATVSALSEMAGVGRLTILCGAGITIDRTGMSWARLVNAIMKDRNKIPTADISDEDADRICTILPPVEAATLAAHYIDENADGSENARTALHSSLQSNLYPLSDWNKGRLVENIVRLAVHRARIGLETQILTTNYDTFLEEGYTWQRKVEIELQPETVDKFPGLQVIVLGEKGADGSWVYDAVGEVSSISLKYLHGYVPRSGRTLGHVAFTEKDYIQVEPLVADALAAAFTNSHVLILGASLTDQPLLTALMRTKLPQNGAVQRYGLLAMQGFTREEEPLRCGQANALAEHLPSRMKEFGLELLMPDFFSQVAQFVEELRIHGTPKHTDHEARLNGWWQNWSKHYYKDWPRLLDCHIALNDTLADIEHELGRPRRSGSARSEYLKLELWVRIPVGNGSRTLELWASSAAIGQEVENLRRGRLSIATQYSSVKAFQMGTPRRDSERRIATELMLRSAQEPRWHTFFSVPIEVDLAEGDLTVGVLTLASTAEDTRSRIKTSRPRRLRVVAGMMRSIGEEYLKPTPKKSKREKTKKAP